MRCFLLDSWTVKPFRSRLLAGIALVLQFASEVRQLIDETHVGAYPATTGLDHAVDGVEVEMSVFVESIRNDQRGRTTDTELAVDED